MICKERPDLIIDGLEAVWAETKIEQQTFLICSMYRPPSSLVAYWDLIDESIKNVLNTPHKFLILGDINSDWLNNPSPHLLNITKRNHLYQLVHEVTRQVTDETPTCIDHIYTPSRDFIREVKVLPPICSDHHVICVKLNIERRIQKILKRTVMNYSKLNKELFIQKLTEINFINVFINNPTEDSARLFSEKFMEVAKQCMPSKTIKMRADSAPWINDHIMLLREQKNFIHQIAKLIDNETQWAFFRRTRNMYTDEIRKRKKDYIQELDNKISTNNFVDKQWWKLVNSFLKQKDTKKDEIPPITHENTTLYTDIEKANCLNNYFEKQSNVDGETDPLPHVNRVETQIAPFTITTNEITETINKLDVTKAVGPDLIHNKLLLAACPVINEPLAFLFNKSLTEGVFPTIWKTAHIVPIYKKGDKSNCSNYRPIALLSCVGKVLEKCIQKRIVEYLNNERLISVSQSGFRKGDSTIYQLLTIYDDLCNALDKNIISQAIFFDISKAFDRVWHRGLIHKLNAIGIRGELNTWLKSYLSGRKQAVVIRGSASEYKTVSAGVPQGSVLGPLLFLVYINDITVDIGSIIKLFADDTSMYLILNDDVMRGEILNSDLRKVKEWASNWKVTFNCQKTELLNVCRRNTNITNDLRFDGSTLIASSSHKHLGLNLQGDCKWDTHIETLLTKCRPLVSCLTSYKYRLSRKSLETMYKSFIVPLLDYADTIWDNCTQHQAETLEKLNLDAMRTITGTVRGTSHHKLYKEAGFITLKERRERHKLILYFKYINNLLPEHIHHKFPRLVSELNPYHVRRPLDRHIPFSRTELYKTSFFPSTTVLWNSLPDNVKTSSSISAFKRYLSRNDPIVPSYYYVGDRIPQLIHCRLRLNMSDLNYDLFQRHLFDNLPCVCSSPQEDANHYLLNCPRYENIRKTTIGVLPPLAQNCDTLLFGNLNYSSSFNTYLFLIVQEFITLSGRFDL